MNFKRRVLRQVNRLLVQRRTEALLPKNLPTRTQLFLFVSQFPLEELPLNALPLTPLASVMATRHFRHCPTTRLALIESFAIRSVKFEKENIEELSDQNSMQFGVFSPLETEVRPCFLSLTAICTLANQCFNAFNRSEWLQILRKVSLELTSRYFFVQN